MSWIGKIMPTQIRTENSARRSVPEGLWTKCEQCSAVLYRAELERSHEVCPKCGDHRRMTARQRIDSFLDPQPRTEIAPNLEPVDSLKFKDTRRYKELSLIHI